MEGVCCRLLHLALAFGGPELGNENANTNWIKSLVKSMHLIEMPPRALKPMEMEKAYGSADSISWSLFSSGKCEVRSVSFVVIKRAARELRKDGRLTGFSESLLIDRELRNLIL